MCGLLGLGLIESGAAERPDATARCRRFVICRICVPKNPLEKARLP